MKRSQMIENVVNIIDSGLTQPSDREAIYATVEEYLDLFEKQGMLPPNRPILIEFEPPYVELLPGVPMMGQIENSNTWDPEDA